jgi:hypothetical protein
MLSGGNKTMPSTSTSTERDRVTSQNPLLASIQSGFVANRTDVGNHQKETEGEEICG